MKNYVPMCLLAATLIAVPALAGDPLVGKQKATACMACHGSQSFGGIFYTLQLGGRDADTLVSRAMKYKTGKILQPMMNMVTAFYSEKDIEDVAAYYQSLGKPAFTSRFFTVKGDAKPNNADVATPPAPAMP